MAHGFPLEVNREHDGRPADQGSDQRDLTAVAEELERLASRNPGQPEEVGLWIAAGELVEFATGKLDWAFQCYSRAVVGSQAPPAALQGLRRLARKSSRGLDQIGALYQLEYQHGEGPEQVARAAIQYALWTIRHGPEQPIDELVTILSRLDTQDRWTKLLALKVLAELHLTRREHEGAAHLLVSHWELAKRTLEPSHRKGRQELAQLAASLGLVYRYLLQREQVAVEWYRRSFELVPSELILRELAFLKWGEQHNSKYQEGLAQLSDLSDTPGGRARAAFELGMLRAYRLGDKEGAQKAFFKGMHQLEGGLCCAAPYLGVVRAQRQPDHPEALVDALGLSTEVAATARERADGLYLMAVVFEREMHLPDAAIDVLRDALACCPDHRPASKALGRLYHRRGAWASLAALLAEEVQRDPALRRSRMKLAEVLVDHLEAPDKAEPHLRQVLADGLYAPAVSRLEQILRAQGRWQELYELQVECAWREQYPRDRLVRLEEAAHIAESRLNRLELALERWQEIHRLDPLHSGALYNLRRLLFLLGRHGELVDLNKAEIRLRDEPEVATRLWTETGEIHERYLLDEEEAARCYAMALEISPAYEPALEALGRILWRNGDWEGLIDVYEAEIAACSDPMRRQRRLLDLGELQAVQADRPEAALATFKQALEADPGSEEALLWLERVYQSLQDDRGVLSILEKRQELLQSEPHPFLALRAASHAEWALDDPVAAWDHYLDALDQSQTRHHAVVGLWRLWPRLHAMADQRDRALRCLIPILREEEDPQIKALVMVLVSRLERGDPCLEEWTEAYQQSPRDPLARGATELQLVLDRRLDDLSAMRVDDRLGSLWSLVATMDARRSDRSACHPDWLPDTAMTAEILAEIDSCRSAAANGSSRQPEAVAVEGITPEAGAKERSGHRLPDGSIRPGGGNGSSTSFRRLVRAWVNGMDIASNLEAHASIPVLRLLSQAALEAGDEAEASQYVELESGLWSQAARRQECLLKAAELRWGPDPRSGRQLYEKALACGCYDEESREQVYESLRAHDQYEILIEGLQDQLTHTKEPQDRVRWLKRLALAQEHDGQRNRALESWQQVILIEPGSATAHLEAIRLLTLEGYLDEARAHLAQALGQQFAPTDRLLLLARQADLHLMEGGDGKVVIRALEEAVTLSGNDNEWVRRLARAHAAHGDKERALTLLTRVLPAAFELPDLGDWSLLARLKYRHLNDGDGARELLWGLLEQFPEELDCLKELEIYYRTCGGANDLAERLSTFVASSSDRLSAEVRGFLWEYLGDLYYHVLRRNRDAQLAFEAAAGAVGPIVRLSLRAARAVGQQPGKGREACARYAAALRQQGVGVAEWIEAVEDLEAIFDGIEEPARVRIIRQIGGLLNGSYPDDAAEGRIKRDPARQVEQGVALEKLTDNLVMPGSLTAIITLEPLMERCFGDRRARRRELGGRRIRSGEVPELVNLLQLGAETIGSTAPRIYVGNGSDQPEWLGIGAYWLPEDLVENLDPLALRFWAGHFTAAGAIGMHAVTLAQPGEIEAILEEIERLNHGGEISREPMLREVAAPRFKTLREKIRPLMEQHPDLVKRAAGENWATFPFLVADRFGLLLAGDVRAAVDSVLSLERNPPRFERAERIVADLRSKRILEYALSYAYQELRYLCGLAAKPRLL
ncbi:MAG: hypothetical protein JW797_08070 [Bradymonadales bacterium]|nr:hypothetical protein [Bradymonadales bacterium]